MLSTLHEGLRLQVALSSVGQHLARLPVLCDNPQLLQRTALLVEQQAAPEGAGRSFAPMQQMCACCVPC